ncbi:MAG: hypothetical protein LRS46_02785 [Desulfurococcales archaeon]|nr:hypothetical protein [Desulfurococcales archaeon]
MSILPRGRRRSSTSKRAGASKSSGTRATSARKSSSRRTVRRPKIDVDAVSSEVSKELVERLGLDYYGLSPDDIKDIVADIVQGIAASRSTKPSNESILKNILRNKDSLLKAVAAMLLDRGPPYTVEQLELIISYAPELAGRAAPLLYHEARRLGAEHIVEALRDLWRRYGRPTPIQCPRCGFHAVTPELTCMVCGASLSEEEVKRAVGFRRLLESFARRSSPQLVLEVIRAGYVVLDDEVKPPSLKKPGEFGVQLFLSREEKELLRSLLASQERA